MSDPTRLPAWQSLGQHHAQLGATTIAELFAADPDRFRNFSARFGDLVLDYSKNRISDVTLSLLFDLAREAGLDQARADLFAGKPVNNTENRPALHMALRAQAAMRDKPLVFAAAGVAVAPDVTQELDHMFGFAQEVRLGAFLGATGKRLQHVVNIGIGGSDLGPALVVDALRPDIDGRMVLDFVSNVDGAHLDAVLARTDPETTLFIIASKTFTTAETMANARAARKWLAAKLGEAAVDRHFVAVSTNIEAVRAFGIDPQRMFRFWDWVGGRYSLWSAIGLSIVLAIGPAKFRDLLAGAADMDRHFLEAPLQENLPVILGLLQVWHRNFCGHATQAILPYAQDLWRLPAYLQQLEMESNGKSVTRDGGPVTWETSPVIWGQAGTNGQHAFHQMLHQGTEPVPCDFILAARDRSSLPAQHQMLFANGLAQSAALAFGRSAADVAAAMRAAGQDGAVIERLVPHRSFAGNRPSTTIVLPVLDAYHLGALIALYEHKVFVAATIWGINPFDQWGVELGKELANALLAGSDAPADSSTAGLMALYDAAARRR
ncbi:glucose-6-phosphate isomerase [Dongia mobilis]|uniref:Glucose-6-phosphate isomerase n=1 Tax=Dongia mobilis TaxID=578943 RepID=A0A4R6WVI3_9PROT|nr:glucose-6-phosphate isomerase [Dongia mobilis]TDQ83326.1 glucose-6-phosphate isomerase [Dongia mobilis]